MREARAQAYTPDFVEQTRGVLKEKMRNSARGIITRQQGKTITRGIRRSETHQIMHAVYKFIEANRFSETHRARLQSASHIRLPVNGRSFFSAHIFLRK